MVIDRIRVVSVEQGYKHLDMHDVPSQGPNVCRSLMLCQWQLFLSCKSAAV